MSMRNKSLCIRCWWSNHNLWIIVGLIKPCDLRNIIRANYVIDFLSSQNHIIQDTHDKYITTLIRIQALTSPPIAETIKIQCQSKLFLQFSTYRTFTSLISLIHKSSTLIILTLSWIISSLCKSYSPLWIYEITSYCGDRIDEMNTTTRLTSQAYCLIYLHLTSTTPTTIHCLWIDHITLHSR